MNKPFLLISQPAPPNYARKLSMLSANEFVSLWYKGDGIGLKPIEDAQNLRLSHPKNPVEVMDKKNVRGQFRWTPQENISNLELVFKFNYIDH